MSTTASIHHHALDISTIGLRKQRAVDIGSSKKDNDTYDTVRQSTEWILERLEEESPFFEQNPPYTLPTFTQEEVELGPELGRGEFGIVLEVSALHVPGDCPCARCRERRATSPSAAAATKRQHAPEEGNEMPSVIQVRAENAPSFNHTNNDSSPPPLESMTAGVIPSSPIPTPPSSNSHTATTTTVTTRLPACPSSLRESTPRLLDSHHHRNGSRISFADDVKLPDDVIEEIARQWRDSGDDDDDDDDDDDESTLSTDEDDDTIPDYPEWERLGKDDEQQQQQQQDPPDNILDMEPTTLVDGEVAYLRSYMSTHCSRHGRPRYALKRLRSEDVNESVFLEAAIDLAAEAKFLARLKHPNLVKMRGTLGQPGTLEFGIVMDCLVLTLQEKMQQWRDEAKGQSTGGGWLGRLLKMNKNQEVLLQDQFADQLLAMYDIARAMRYLHNHFILFRDLKPENVAFDLRGEMRLFDFGLAKELKQRDLVNPPNGFEATGMTGSRRYMAPEVVLCKLYGLPADVYSFSIVMWEVLAGQSAYPHWSLDQHFDHVVVKGKRPSRRIVSQKTKNVSKSLVKLLEDMWNPDPSQRPSFTLICNQIGSECVLSQRLAGGHNSHGHRTHLSDRTSYLTNRSIRSRCESSAGDGSVQSKSGKD